MTNLDNNTLENIAHWKTRIAVGRMAFDAGFYSQAAKHFRTALELLKENNPSSELLSINLICLAKALSCTGNYTEAEKLINEALQIDTANQDNRLQLASDYLELSSISWKQHRIDQCETYANKALELLNSLDNKEKENQSPAIARAYKLLTLGASDRGNYDQGLKFVDKALNILEHSRGGMKSEAYGEALLAKVMLLIDRGDTEQIQPTLEDALQLIELHKGEFHPQLGHVLNILAEHTKRRGEQELGNKFKKQAKEIENKGRKSSF